MYVPILKGKPGEFQAIKKLFPETVEGIIPFIDFPNIELTEEGSEKVSLDVHLNSICENILSSWVSDFYFDLNLELNKRTSQNIHPVKYVFDYLNMRGLKPFLTIGLDRDEGYILACREILVKTDVRICLRFLRTDIQEYWRSPEKLHLLIEKLNVTGMRYEIMFDLKSIENDELFKTIEIVVRTISKMLDLGLGNTFIVAGGSWPRSLNKNKFKADTTAEIPRFEMSLWRGIFFKLFKRSVNLFFSDYGAVHWDFVELSEKAKKRGISARVRYTTTDKWLLSKGHKIQKNDQQYSKLARKIVASASYITKEFSWGDARLFNSAVGKGGARSPQGQIAVDTNHHITYVKNEIFQTFKVSPIKKSTLIGQVTFSFKN